MGIFKQRGNRNFLGDLTLSLYLLSSCLWCGCGRYGIERLSWDSETASDSIAEQTDREPFSTENDSETATAAPVDSETIATDSDVTDTQSESASDIASDTDTENLTTDSLDTGIENTDSMEIGSGTASSDSGASTEPNTTDTNIGTDSEYDAGIDGGGTETDVVSFELTVLGAGYGTVSPSGTTTVIEGQAYALEGVPWFPYQFEFWKQTGGEGTVEFGNAAEGTTVATVTGGDATITAYFDNTIWSNSKTITLDTTSNGADVAETVNEFPLLVRLDSTNFSFDETMQHGEDIRFTSVDGEPLAYEIEKWDTSEESAEIWVKVPTVTGNGTTDIVMRWGQPDAVSQSRGGAVFGDTGFFTSVWHLGDTFDSTENSNDLAFSDIGTPFHPSIIGDGITLDGSTWLNTDTGTLLGDTGISLSLWVKTSQAEEMELLSQRDVDTGDVGAYRLVMQSDGTVLFDVYNIVWQWNLQLVSTQAINDGQWHHIFAIRSGTSETGWIYIDGIHSGFSTGPVQPLNGDIGVYIGKNVRDNSNVFVGEMDEIRIQHDGFFEAWLRLCYENQRPEDYLLNPTS